MPLPNPSSSSPATRASALLQVERLRAQVDLARQTAADLEARLQDEMQVRVAEFLCHFALQGSSFPVRT